MLGAVSSLSLLYDKLDYVTAGCDGPFSSSFTGFSSFFVVLAYCCFYCLLMQLVYDFNFEINTKETKIIKTECPVAIKAVYRNDIRNITRGPVR